MSLDLFVSGQGGYAQLLTYAPTAVAGFAPVGAAAGQLSSPLSGAVFSWISGSVSVAASTGVVTTSAGAPSGLGAANTIIARVRVQDAANSIDEELVIAVPVTAAPPAKLASPFTAALGLAFAGAF